MHINPITTSTISNNTHNTNRPKFKGTADFSGLNRILENNGYSRKLKVLNDVMTKIEAQMEKFSKETRLVFEYKGQKETLIGSKALPEPYHTEIYSATIENPNSNYKHILSDFEIFNNPDPASHLDKFVEIYKIWTELLKGPDLFRLHGKILKKGNVFTLSDDLYQLKDIKEKSICDINRFKTLLENIKSSEPHDVERKFFDLRK